MTDYARIGVGYAERRVADARIEAQIHAALGDATMVLNVGAGTGIFTRLLARSGCRSVTAVEPNADMRERGLRDSDGDGGIDRGHTSLQSALASDLPL